MKRYLTGLFLISVIFSSTSHAQVSDMKARREREMSAIKVCNVMAGINANIERIHRAGSTIDVANHYVDNQVAYYGFADDARYQFRRIVGEVYKYRPLTDNEIMQKRGQFFNQCVDQMLQ